MFGEFAQETKKLEDCAANCSRKYLLKAHYKAQYYYSIYSLDGEEVIVT